MSFILDALRRAESERARGAVPGLESRALPLAGDDEPSRAAPTRGPWIAAGLAAGALVLGLAGWWLTRDPAGTATVAPVAPAAPQVGVGVAPGGDPTPLVPPALPTLPATPAPTLRSPLATPERAATHVAALPTGPAATFPAVPLPGGGSVRIERSRGSVAPPPAAAAPHHAAAQVAAPTATPAATPASAAADARPLPLAQLSPQQRAELPPMAIGGAIYSESPASRFILVNGQVVREGELAAPGVTLERIGPRSAVIRWRGLRIEIPQ